jgi:hypothetical protein
MNLGRRIGLFRARMSELLGLQWGCALNSENEKKRVLLGCDGLAIWAACLARQGQHRLAPGGLWSSLPQLFLLVQAGQQQGSTMARYWQGLGNSQYNKAAAATAELGMRVKLADYGVLY